MQELQDLGINLLAAGIAFGVGLSSNQARNRWRTRSTRAFWKPYANGEFRVITPIHQVGEDQTIERAEWVGLGDVIALVTLQDAVSALGIDKLVVRPSNRLNDDDWRSNLILIGGPWTNTVTGDALARLDINVGFGSLAQPSTELADVHDVQSSRTWSRVRTPDGKRTRTDYGIVVRAISPFNARRTILILAGGTAFGTAGAAMLCQKAELLDHPAVRSGGPFEAVCAVDVAGGAPREVEAVLVRTLVQP
ncbi:MULTISPECIES: hypothetical protein [Nocardia]|uniref:hypothetical protein n=1 Tax=Nocardia abscessus TaxID=120957 RepID=UPI001895F313|nr:hypothetical protein [Nocardia abscessus]MBF6476511.1 hypothetical protein [Nocardia abscessus]